MVKKSLYLKFQGSLLQKMYKHMAGKLQYNLKCKKKEESVVGHKKTASVITNSKNGAKKNTQ